MASSPYEAATLMRRLDFDIRNMMIALCPNCIDGRDRFRPPLKQQLEQSIEEGRKDEL